MRIFFFSVPTTYIQNLFYSVHLRKHPETYVISEIIKSYYSSSKDYKREVYYYRDKDQKEVDLIYVESEILYPIEIKKGVSPINPDKNFDILNKYSNNVSEGIVICMTNKLQPINKKCWLCPVEYI